MEKVKSDSVVMVFSFAESFVTMRLGLKYLRIKNMHKNIEAGGGPLSSELRREDTTIELQAEQEEMIKRVKLVEAEMDEVILILGNYKLMIDGTDVSAEKKQALMRDCLKLAEKIEALKGEWASAMEDLIGIESVLIGYQRYSTTEIPEA